MARSVRLAAILRVLRRAQKHHHRSNRLGLAHALGPHQDLDRLGIGVELLWLLRPQQRYVWPLAVGGNWEQTVAVTTGRDGKSSTETRVRSCQVAGEETVTVAGGVYRTIKTTCRDKSKQVVFEVWYAPEVKHWVKEWTRFSWGVQERELMAVKLK